MLADRSIRQKLVIGFGALMLLGALNIAINYVGANRRQAAWEDVQQAIRRQIIVTEVRHDLEDQKKFVDLLAGVVGVEGGAPVDGAQDGFARTLDTVTVQLEQLVALAAPERRPAAESLHKKTAALAASWKRFYGYQWTSPSEAVAELYTNAEPLAEELLAVDFPEAVTHERAALAQISADFVRLDRTFGRIAWLSFLLSALIGGSIAIVISRDILGKISALKTGTERLGSGDLAYRIAIPGSDELSDVADSFNEMAGRLKERSDELATQRDDLTRAVQRLRATQAKLVQQEKLASLGALTAGIAHEIKNPLNFINNFADVCVELVDDLRAELDDDGVRSNGEPANGVDDRDAGSRTGLVGAPEDRRGPDVRGILEDLSVSAGKIREHGQRADRIVRSMLLHSRQKSGEYQSTDINTFIDEYVNLAYHGMRAQDGTFSVEIECRLDEEVREITLVPQEMGRVVINLLNNAFYAVSERAAEEVEGYAPRVVVETIARRDGVALRISDNGFGIPDEVRERIFEPFYTTKPTGDGTGLGLSLVHDIVTQLHGGTIDVASETGRGASFTVFLPDRVPDAAP